jgi:hypothetical protein
MRRRGRRAFGALLFGVGLAILPAAAIGQDTGFGEPEYDETALESGSRYGSGSPDASAGRWSGDVEVADTGLALEWSVDTGIVDTAVALDQGAETTTLAADISTDTFVNDESASSETAPDTAAYEESLAEPLPAEEPAADPAATEVIAATPSPSRGFNTGQLIFFNDADLNRALDAMAASRSSIHRLTIMWWDIQKDGPGEWSIGPYDRVIKAAAARGLRLVLNPMGSPNWARNANRRVPDDPNNPFRKFGYPDNVTAWGAFIRRLAQEYNPEGFEIWNEQNSRAFWDPTPTRSSPSPSRWTSLFCRAAREIRALRPLESVGMGGLAPHRANQRDPDGRIRNMQASEYVRRAYGAGLARCNLTFVGYHPYLINTYCIGRERPLSTAPGIVELRRVRGAMVARGHGAKKIWNTEWGFPSKTFRESATSDCRYSEARQAEMVRREHLYLRQLSYMRFSIYFNIKDALADAYRDAFVSIGMLRASADPAVDWSPKPSYRVWTGLP